MQSIRHKSLLTWWVDTCPNLFSNTNSRSKYHGCCYSAFVVGLEHLFVNAAKQNGPDRTLSKLRSRLMIAQCCCSENFALSH